jgi:phosphatidylethanolamine-binding protein (PEBP) family uncharacterized protein
MRVASPPVPAGSKQTQPGLDGSTWYGYAGPCPQSANQSYLFSVYALKVYALKVATLPGVTSQSTGAAVDKVIQMNKLAMATLNVMASK